MILYKCHVWLKCDILLNHAKNKEKLSDLHPAGFVLLHLLFFYHGKWNLSKHGLWYEILDINSDLEVLVNKILLLLQCIFHYCFPSVYMQILLFSPLYIADFNEMLQSCRSSLLYLFSLQIIYFLSASDEQYSKDLLLLLCWFFWYSFCISEFISLLCSVSERAWSFDCDIM